MKKQISFFLIASLMFVHNLFSQELSELEPAVKSEAEVLVETNLETQIEPDLSPVVKICAVKGGISVPFAYLAEDEKYSFSFVSSADQAVSMLSYGDADCTILSYNAAKLIEEKSSGKVSICAAVSFCDYSLVTGKKGIKTISNLLGKTIYVVKDSQEEVFFRQLLKKTGLPVGKTDGCVNIDTSLDYSEIVSSMLAKKIDNAVLGGTCKNTVLRKGTFIYEGLNLYEEFINTAGNRSNDLIPLTVLVCRTQFINENTELFRDLMKDLRRSCDSVMSNPYKTSSICSKYDFGLNSVQATSYIKAMNLTFSSLIAK